LTGWDEDKLIDLYDVRIGGGFAEPPLPPIPCEGDECQGVPAAVPSFTTASGFSGLGNQTFAPIAKSIEARRLTVAQRLGRALRACRRKPARERARCRMAARKRFAAKSKAKHASRRAGR
jgi:hypothetical protein